MTVRGDDNGASSVVVGWGSTDNATLAIAGASVNTGPNSISIDGYGQGSVTVSNGGTLTLGTSLPGNGSAFPGQNVGGQEIGNSTTGGLILENAGTLALTGTAR